MFYSCKGMNFRRKKSCKMRRRTRIPSQHNARSGGREIMSIFSFFAAADELVLTLYYFWVIHAF